MEVGPARRGQDDHRQRPREGRGQGHTVYRLLQARQRRDSEGQGRPSGVEKTAAAAPNGKPASRTADAYLGYGDNAKAIELYKLALTKGGVDNDEVNTRLGIALLALGRSGRREGGFHGGLGDVAGPQADC